MLTTEMMMSRQIDVSIAPHPGKSLYKEYMNAWARLDATDRALHKIAETETYCNYQLAKKYGVQVQNIVNNDRS